VIKEQVTSTEAADSAWGKLYRIGGYAALMALAVVLIEGLIVVIIQAVWLNSGRFGVIVGGQGGQPGTVIGWFNLFQNNRLIGLLDDAILDIAVVALLGPVFLALFAPLRRTNQSWMAVATPLAFAGIAAYVATNTSLSLLYLSDQYAAATAEAQRSLLLAAGQGIIAVGGGGLFWSTGFILVAVAGLIVAAVMRTGKLFGIATAWAGILANGLFLVNYIASVFVSATSNVSTILVGCATILMFIWWILIARKLFQLDVKLKHGYL